MKRTARYETIRLNRCKWQEIVRMVLLYTALKESFLRLLGKSSEWDALDKPKDFRDDIKEQYMEDLPIHLQDQAAFDAIDIVRRFIDSCLARTHIRAKAFSRFADQKRHYAFWILKSYERIGDVLRGESPVPEFEISRAECKDVVRFLRSRVRKSLGRPPRVKVRRSMALDSTLYRVFERKGRQYVAIASQKSGRRLVLPLRGKGAVHGNIRIVLDFSKKCVVVHMPYDVRIPVNISFGPSVGLDAGVTEVLASSNGEKYGQGYGKLLEGLSEQTTTTGKIRNKLYQLANKAEAKGDVVKASHIRRNNLGRKKLVIKRVRSESSVKTLVGEAVKKALQSRPEVVAVEDLSHLRGRTKGRKLSRIVSRWMRSVLRERLDFRTTAGCSRRNGQRCVYQSDMSRSDVWARPPGQPARGQVSLPGLRVGW